MNIAIFGSDKDDAKVVVSSVETGNTDNAVEVAIIVCPFPFCG